MEDVENIKRAVPFLRWTGSKRWFTKSYVSEFLPPIFNNYHEPFLGGGSVFFYLTGLQSPNERAFYLSDSNKELINAYVQIRDNPEIVIEYLKKFINTESHYYAIRQLKPKTQEKQAARFIYLNRTSFNGIYRVNSNGLYNVPYGRRIKVDVVTEELLRGVSSQLQGISIESRSFDETISNVKKNDLVFLDPPYTVAHENNGFIAYNQHLFSWDHQEKLKEYVKEIIKKEAYFILTNASHKSILDLYEGIGQIKKLSRISQVGGRNKTRGSYNELIITNTNI